MNRFFQSVPIINTPRKLYASLKSVKTASILCLTISLSVILNGKTRCFSVLAAELQNETCNSVQDTCGMATLNWIAFLSETIIVGGNPFITNMFIRVHSGVLGGRVTFQFCMLLTLGTLLTGFVSDPESLFVTDTLIQGVATSVLLGLVSFKLIHMYPDDHANHRAALLLSEIAPWFGVLLCPLYGVLVSVYGWQSSYLLISLLIMIVCLLAGIIEPKVSLTSSTEDDNDSETDSIQNQEVINSQNYFEKSDYWEIEDTQEVECQHPSLLQLLLNVNISQVISKSEVVVWFVERALMIIAEFNLIINIVHYMTSVLYETIYNGSIIMITLGAGCIMGYLTIYVLDTKIRKHLIKVYMVASVMLVISFIVWQIYGSKSNLDVFTVPDAHFMIIVIGVFTAMTSAQSYYVAEDIIERPKIISVSLTKVAQSIGLLIGPISSGMLIQINYFHSFFSVQAFIHSVRIMLLAFIFYKKYQ